ncbi:MAG: AMIN domain-containing protein, partial [Betaproteobacteria bacterium]
MSLQLSGRGLSHGRKISLCALIVATLLLPLPVPAWAGAQIVYARVWPAPEYTRLTLESDAPIAYNVFTVGMPPRLVLDLENVEFNVALEQIPAKISPTDPYVSAVRIGRFKP